MTEPATEHVVTLSAMINELLGKGYSPQQIRRELQSRGIVWSYKYDRAKQGLRECQRRLKQQGLKFCVTCAATYSVTLDECPSCQVEKWTGVRPLPGEVR